MSKLSIYLNDEKFATNKIDCKFDYIPKTSINILLHKIDSIYSINNLLNSMTTIIKKTHCYF